MGTFLSPFFPYWGLENPRSCRYAIRINHLHRTGYGLELPHDEGIGQVGDDGQRCAGCGTARYCLTTPHLSG